MTYSYDSNDATNGTVDNIADVDLDSYDSNDATFGIVDIVADVDLDLNNIDEIVNVSLEDMTWENAEFIGNILECHGRFQLKNSVPTYEIANKNPDAYQFPDCPDARSFLYPSGWDYQDYKIGEDTGFTYPNTRKVRLGEIGPPVGFENEVNNPGRINTLPNREKKWITTEPKHILWVHPYLETAVEDVPDEVESFASNTRGTPRGIWDSIEEEVPLSFSFFTTMKKWQSGQIHNSPMDFEISNRAGFHTSPGGKFQNLSGPQTLTIPSTIKYQTKEADKKWIAVYGYSRGKEGMGYPDEPTEGLEYGAVGVSGWFTTIYNKSANTYKNCGLKYAYVMGRVDVSGDELQVNLLELIEILNNLDSGFEASGHSINETQDFGPTHDLADIDVNGGGPGVVIGEDRKKLKEIIHNIKNRLDFRRDPNNIIEFNYEKFVKSQRFRELKNKKLGNNSSTHQAIAMFYDIANYFLNEDKGIPEAKHVTLISCDSLMDKVSRGQDLSVQDFFNDFLSRIILGRDDVIDKIPFIIDHVDVADNPNGFNAQLIKFIYLVTEDRLVKKFKRQDGELCAELSTGFTISMTQFLSGFDGWCEACVNSGGTIVHPDAKSAVCAVTVYDEKDPDKFDINELDIYYYEDGEGVHGFDSFYSSTPASPPVPSQGSSRTLLPSEPGTPVDVTINGTNRTATEWRGLWAVPAPSYGAKPDWKKWYIDGVDPATGDPNFLHTYGPFNYDDFDLFYHWIFPPNNHELDPRMDYHITFWVADRPDAPSSEWKQGVTTPPKNAGQRSRGFATSKPTKSYFRICFCQWKTSNTLKGPKVKEYMYAPGYKVPGKPAYNGTSPHGIWFDVIVTPLVGNPFDHYDDNTKGPCYQTPSASAELPDLHDFYWKKPVNTLQLQANQYYKIWSKPSSKQGSDALKERNTPKLQGVYATSNKAIALNPEKDWGFEGYPADYWKDGWFLDTHLKGEGETYYRTIKIDNKETDTYIFASKDPSRANQVNDWQENGEPWVEYRKIDRNKWIFGPAYWGELHPNRSRPNFHIDKWQTPLNLWDTNIYRDMWTQDPLNVNVYKTQRLHLSADRGRTGTDPNGPGIVETTLYDYDVYIPYDHDQINIDLNREQIAIHQAGNKPSFIFLGTIHKTDYNGFTVTVPVDSTLIFQARNTGRLKDSWKNNGEPINIRTRETENARDERKGPAYWAFGDYGLVSNNKKGFRGYVDFNDAYWSNPLNHWNSGVGGGIPVKKGRRYELTPGANMIYTHRVIWGLDETESASPILYNNPQLKNDHILDTPNRVHYAFEDDIDKLLRPAHSGASKPIVVTAQSDIMLFGAFRYDQSDDSNLVDRPTKEQWSRFGEDIDITVRELPDIYGCGYWASEGAHSAVVKADMNSFERPLYSLTDEMKAIVNDDREADPNSPTLEELEGYVKEIGSPEDPNFREKWTRRFAMEKGKNYVVVATDRTPPYHLSPRSYGKALSKNIENWQPGDGNDGTTDEQRNFVWIINRNDDLPDVDPDESSENVHRMLDVQYEEIWYDVFYAGKPRNQWSNRGERLYLELWETEEVKGLKAKQYWTDWADDNTATNKYTPGTANDQLGNVHWDNPLYRLPADKFKPGSTYKIWVDDSPNALGNNKPNPNYQTVFFADKDPNAIQVGTPKDYQILGTIGDQKLPINQRWKGPNNNMNGEANACKITISTDKPMVVVGAWHTGNRRNVGHDGQAPGGLDGWNSGGEEITLKWELVPQENPKGPVYWADHYAAGKYQVISEESSDIEDLWAFPDLGRGEDITKERDKDTNPAYYTQCYEQGEIGNEVSIRAGKQYRILIPDDKFINDNKDYIEPSEYVDDVPYCLRWWFLNNPAFALDPTQSNYSYFEPGRSTNGLSHYHDFIAQTNHLVFGAHANLEGRGENTWSRVGEPSLLTIRALPRAPYSGPGYYTHTTNIWTTPTHTSSKHFYHPLNVVPVETGATFEVVEGADWSNPEWRNVKIQIIYLLDDYKSNWEVINEHWKKRFDITYLPIPFEARHPEDLLIRNAAMQEDISDPNADYIYEKELFEYFYKLGPVIDLNVNRNIKFKIPENCSRAFYAIEGWKDIEQYNRDGENVPFTIRKVDYGNIEGPLYWGDNAPLVAGSHPPAEFDNTHFENPLRHVVVTQGKLIKLTKRNANSFDNYDEVDIYSFNHRQESNLDPSKVVLANFRLVGTFKKTDTNLTIDPENTGLIFSARKINPAYNKQNVTDWSPKGEPHPFNIEETDDIRGPVYYADEDAKWQNPAGAPAQANLPNFELQKWNDPIQAFRYAKADGEFELELRETYSASSLDVWVTSERSALNPGGSHASPSDWYYVGTFARGATKGTKLLLPKMDEFNTTHFYIVCGAYGFRNGGDRTLEDWSDWGEPVDLRVVQKEWDKGPGFPAYRKQTGDWEIDLDETRWKWGNPLVPQRRRTFTAGKKYKFKKIPGPTHDKEYQIVWSTKKVPTEKRHLNYNTGTHKYINPNKPSDQSFELIAPPGADYVFFSMFDNGNGVTHGNGNVRDWSPDGTSIPYKASRVWELPPMPNWLELLIKLALGLLLSLLGVLMYYALIAPLEILLEMDVEHGQNEYYIQRKKLKTYEGREGRERIGYGYPNEIEYLNYDHQFAQGEPNVPVFFNYTADAAVRAWARVMKFRHNGYFLHFTNIEKKNTSDDFTKDNWIQLYNLTPTFGRNFVRLSGSNTVDLGFNARDTKLKRAFRYRNNEIKERDEDIKRWDPVLQRGTKVLKPCTVNDPVKQQTGWDDKLTWFSPTLGYAPMATREGWHYTRGRAAYKIAANFPTWGVPYTSGCTVGPHYILWNIFNDIGGGFTSNKSFSNDVSCHAQSFEIVNGDTSFTWPVDDMYPNEFYPGIEFDLIWPSTSVYPDRESLWQLNQMHLNFYTFSEFNDNQEDQIDSRFFRKLRVISDNYVMRNSFEPDAALNTLSQLNKDRRKIHIEMMASEVISRAAILDSISINIWLGSGCNGALKSCIISNLKPISQTR